MMGAPKIEQHLGESLKEKATGNCYQSAFEFVMENRDWVLVHGRAVLTGGEYAGMEYGHAWAEKGDLVMDTETGHRIPKELYYRVGQVGETKKYYPLEARLMARKFGHYGNWE